MFPFFECRTVIFGAKLYSRGKSHFWTNTWSNSLTVTLVLKC